jgi:hypothetical protein
MSFFKRIIKLAKLLYGPFQIKNKMKTEFLNQKLLLGKVLVSNIICHPTHIDTIEKAEFSVFSQFGDDGIIQYLINHIEIPTKKFIEFGVENYGESNTKFLLMNNNWSGLVMDASDKYMSGLRNEDFFWKYNLKTLATFITRENINQILLEQDFKGEIGLLHIDLDGMDWWIWKEISVINPIIVIVEYNSVFGKKDAITVPYQTDFDRTKAHHSYLYWGASLPAFLLLAETKGYAFVGCNSNGNNAYFVRKDKVGGLKIKTVEEGYVESQYRESRDVEGSLTYVTGRDRIELLRGLSIFNIISQQIEKL